jgi:hypothetical protein
MGEDGCTVWVCSSPGSAIMIDVLVCLEFGYVWKLVVFACLLNL